MKFRALLIDIIHFYFSKIEKAIDPLCAGSKVFS